VRIFAPPLLGEKPGEREKLPQKMMRNRNSKDVPENLGKNFPQFITGGGNIGPMGIDNTTGGTNER